MAQAHPYENIELPENVQLELRPSPDPSKGWGAFATQPIKKAVLILHDMPVLAIREPLHLISEARINSVFAQLENKRADYLHFLFLGLSNRAIFKMNNFVITAEGVTAHGLFIRQSRFNHSCMLNAMVTAPEKQPESLICQATRDIAVGREFTFCYEPTFHLLRVHERHAMLTFECHYAACVPSDDLGDTFYQASELRRTLSSGLQYLVMGCDFTSTYTIITTDLTLRARAENFQLPYSPLLFYHLLTMVLLEHKELIDQRRLRIMSDRIMMTACSFRTLKNINVAWTLMKKDTWVEKLVLAAEFRCVSDEADGTLMRKRPTVEELVE